MVPQAGKWILVPPGGHLVASKGPIGRGGEVIYTRDWGGQGVARATFTGLHKRAQASHLPPGPWPCGETGVQAAGGRARKRRGRIGRCLCGSEPDIWNSLEEAAIFLAPENRLGTYRQLQMMFY